MAQSISSNRKTAQQSLRAAAEDLAGEIATLSTLEPAALLQKWKALFGTDRDFTAVQDSRDSDVSPPAALSR